MSSPFAIKCINTKGCFITKKLCARADTVGMKGFIQGGEKIANIRNFANSPKNILDSFEVF